MKPHHRHDWVVREIPWAEKDGRVSRITYKKCTGCGKVLL